MASSYFTVPSFNRAKKNKEDLEKTNPQEPVLRDEDEKFFDKEMRSGSTSETAKDTPTTKITDDGEEKPATTEEREQAVASDDQTVIPETRPDSAVASGDGSYDDAQKEKAAAAVKERKERKKNKGMDLPSQEEAEAATRGYHAQAPNAAEDRDKAQAEKRTWASYLPTVRGKKAQSAAGEQEKEAIAGETNEEKKEGEQETKGEGDKSTDDTQPKPTWTQYASSYMPTFKSSRTKKPDADGQNTPVYNPDGSINEAATAEKEEREVSVLLDNLNLSSINNRVFSFSADTQRLYERFLLCLKDVINGAPTAYEDMDKLMKEAGPKLEEQWKSMPPFVQTLVKSLPMRLGPEVLAVASENPNDEMKRHLQNASKSGGGGGAGVAAAAMQDGGSAEKGGGKEGEQKQKRKIPGLKSLVSEQGAIATLLRNTVSFIQTRFPFLASTTNVVMSLAVFILMFVFWYCHKRGKEVRLAREAEEGKVQEEEDMVDVSDTADEEEVEEMVEELEKADEQQAAEDEGEQGLDEKKAVLEQPAPSEVPLPDTEAKGETNVGEGEKNDDTEAKTATGTGTT